MKHTVQQSKSTTSRRSFLRKGLAVGGAGAIGAGLFANGLPAFAEVESGGLRKGDTARVTVLDAHKTPKTPLSSKTKKPPYYHETQNTCEGTTAAQAKPTK